MNFVCFCVCEFFFPIPTASVRISVTAEHVFSLLSYLELYWCTTGSENVLEGTARCLFTCSWFRSGTHLNECSCHSVWVPDFKGCWMCDVDTRHCQWAQQICAPELPLCISLLLCTPVAAARQAWDRKKALHLHCSPSCPWKPYFHPEPCLFHNLVNEYHWKQSNFCAQSLFS